MRNTVNILFICGILGLTGVFLGAFGAHALKPRLIARGTTDIWATAVSYQLLHAVALLAVTVWARQGTPQTRKWLVWAGCCWSAGILLFSGSLYALALGGAARVLGPITPLGGLALLAGWACIIGQSFNRTDLTDKS